MLLNNFAVNLMPLFVCYTVFHRKINSQYVYIDQNQQMNGSEFVQKTRGAEETFDALEEVYLKSHRPLDRGPYFDTSATKNVTSLVGKTAHLNCRIKNLGNKTVSINNCLPSDGHRAK